MGLSSGDIFSRVIGAVGAQAEADAAIASFKRNSFLLRKQAGLVEDETVETEREFRVLFRREQGSSRARASASGLTGGSALDVLEQNAREAEFDVAKIKHSGEIKRQSFIDAAVSEEDKARAAKRGGRLGVIGAILGG